MMGYEGRAVLLEDGDEWVNIPLVVREFMRQLNDEVHSSRSVIESMRQEQKEVNQLLRRVMQKQADLEIDSTRNALSLGQVTRSTHDKAENRHSEQIQYLRKKQEKLDDKLQRLGASVSQLSQAQLTSSTQLSNAELTEKVNDLTAEMGSCKNSLEKHKQQAEEVQLVSEARVSAAIAASSSNARKETEEAEARCTTRQDETKETLRLLAAELEDHKHKEERLIGAVESLTESTEKDRQLNSDRLATCFRTVEKLEALYMTQKDTVQAQVRRLECAEEANMTKLQDEAKTLYTDVRDLVKGSQTDIGQRCNELADDLRGVKEQQKRLGDQLANSEAESLALRAVKQSKELVQRITDLEAATEEYTSRFMPRRECQNALRDVAEQFDALKTSTSESKRASRDDIQQLTSALKALRMEHNEDNDWLHSEIARVGAVADFTSQQREKQERQVAALCDVVQSLSKAVEALQAERVSNTSAAVRGTTVGVHENSVALSPPSKTDGATADASPTEYVHFSSWETWQAQFVKEMESKLSTVTGHQHRWERLSQQLNELTAKVDGGAKYAQAMASQHLEQLRQSVRDEVSNQLQSHSALREVMPALVEAEAVKRRVAGTELELQLLGTRLEKWRADSTGTAVGADAGSEKSADRFAALEDSVEGLRRRLLELGEHVVGLDQRHNGVIRATHRLETQVQDQQRVVSKLGTDLTAALESLLHTEQALTQHQSSSSSHEAEVRGLLDTWRHETSTASAVLDTKQSTQHAAMAAVEVTVQDVRANLAQLSAAVGELSSRFSTEYTEKLRAMQAEISAAREECAAAVTTVAATLTAAPRGDKSVESSPAWVEEMELERRRVNSAIEALQKRQTVEEEARRSVELEVRESRERFSVTETLIADNLRSQDALAALQQVEKATACYEEELRNFQGQLDNQQKQLRAITEQGNTKHEACREKLSTLRDEVIGWTVPYVAAQVESLRKGFEDAIRDTFHNAESKAAQASNKDIPVQDMATVSELRQRLNDAQNSAQSRMDELADRQRADLAEMTTQLASFHVSQADLRREVQDALGAEQERYEALSRELRDAVDDVRDANMSRDISRATPRATRSPRTHEEKPRAEASDAIRKQWQEEVLRSLQDTYYTKSLLEERLENIWSSMISLLARKEDMSTVNEKLNGLHQLLQEELQVELERLEGQVANELAEKVSLANLQDILEQHILNPGGPS